MTTLKDTLKQVGYGAARTLIASGAGFLVTAGWLASSKTAAFEDAALGVIGVVGILVWSAGEKLWVYIKAELAKIPPASFEGQVLTAFAAAAPVVEPLAQNAIVAEAAKLDIPLADPPVAVAPLTSEQADALAIPPQPAPFTPAILSGHPLV